MNSSLLTHFGKVNDPRIERSKRHELIDILAITLCGVICGAETWVEIAEFGETKAEWLRQFLKLPNGIPSHDTFGEVFARIDPDEFQACFVAWVQAVMEVTTGQVVAIDGKTLRGSHDKVLGKGAIHMVSAWASASGLVLGQVKVDEKSNEITAIPALLEVLALAGCIVTIDAMGCQTEIAKKIIEKDAQYVLSLKANQPHLHQDVQELFDFACAAPEAPYPLDYAKTVNKGHGRLEIRQCWTLTDPAGFPALRTTSQWSNLQTLVMLRRERRVGPKISHDLAFFITSFCAPAHQMLSYTRSHWAIENNLHWVLDVAFHEDASRVRKDYAAQNLVVIRHAALNLLKSDKSNKSSIHTKRLKAGWDERYLLHLLSH